MQATKKTAKEHLYKSNDSTSKFIFADPKINVSNELRLLLITLDKIFPMQSSEFIKLLYFGSDLNKKITTF